MRLLITAGPTREPIDAVRFISNRSSGRMGIALAEAAANEGHDVTLLMGPGPRNAQMPANCRVLRFQTTADLQQLLAEHFPSCDVLIMAAAVADYRPAQVATGKLPRRSDEALTVTLQPTPDLVAQAACVKRPEQRVIAFALEPAEQLEQRALEKMRRKRVDAIVANPLEAMEGETITATWYAVGDEQGLASGSMSKADFARWLLSRVASLT